MARNFHTDSKIGSTITLDTTSIDKKTVFLDYKVMIFSGLRERGKKMRFLMKKYLIARNTLPTFCDLLVERHASVLEQKLFSISYLGARIYLLRLKQVNC